MQIEASGSVDLNDPPQGAWYQDASDGFVVGATTRNSIGFLVVPAMCLLSVFALSICRGHSVHGIVEPPLMGIIFGLEALVLGSVAVMCICGKVEVRICGTQGRIFTGIGPIGWRRSFDWSGVAWVRITQTFMRHGGPGQCWIDLDGPRRLRFGTLLTQPRCHFIANVLQLKLFGGSQNTGPDC